MAMHRILPVFWLVACGGGDADLVTAPLSVGSTARVQQADGMHTEDADGAAAVVDRVEAVVRDIGLDLPDGSSCADLELADPVRCDEEGDKIIVEGPFFLDLVARTSEPSLDDIELPAGVYRRVDLRFDPNEAADDASLRIGGTLELVDGVRAVELGLPINEDARFEHPDGIEGGGGGSLLALLDLDVLLGAAPLRRCAESGDADDDGTTVWIDGSDCDDVIDGIEEVMKERWDLVDSDDDGPDHEEDDGQD
jgi:hypothetical protein